MNAERLAQWLHHKLAAAQNLPYEDGDTCENCIEIVNTELLPLIQIELTKRLDCGHLAGEWVSDKPEDGHFDGQPGGYCRACRERDAAVEKATATLLWSATHWHRLER